MQAKKWGQAPFSVRKRIVTWDQALPLGKDIFPHSSPYGIPLDKA